MRKLLIIGIGAGDPDHLTLQAVKALRRLDVVFIPDKGNEKEGLRRLRYAICQAHITRPDVRYVEFAVPSRDARPADYTAEVQNWHKQQATLYGALIERELEENQTGAFLVWGDPSLYDSTLRVLQAMAADPVVAFDYEVIPGITSVQALAARHRITLNGIGEPVEITTGRRLRDPATTTKPANRVIMLDGDESFRQVDGDATEIFWGAYLGTPDEMLLSGRLSDVADTISVRRREARARIGWIMDIYLLRRSDDG